MRGPQPAPLTLSAAERDALQQLVRRHTTPQQLAVRARIVLAAADGRNHRQIARDLGVGVDTARLWRQRWLALQAVALADLSVAERFADAPRAGRPARLLAAQVCQIVELACAAPDQSGRPISQWTGREIAAEIMQRGIVDHISGRHAARLLKRGHSSRTAGATG
ncbi:MAG TPA: helix-turn-helix domain-containing protein [Thermomicrobiales bacterium]|jgi:putative transposase|nr:helix-turn-helix domain-containing protein [Thermomicrobiales bacterium]